MRYTGDPEYKEQIGFMIVRGPESTKTLDPKSCPRLVSILDQSSIVFKSTFEFDLSCTRFLELPAYSGVYYVIGYMFHNTDDTTLFNMNIVPLSDTAGECEIFPVLKDFAYRIDDAFKGNSAGGCPNYPTWIQNPQYIIKPLLGRAVINAQIVPGDIRKPQKEITPQSMGLVLFTDPEKKLKVTEFKNTISPMPDYAVAKETFIREIPLGLDQYILMPQSFKPAVQFQYQIFVYSSSPLRFAGITKITELFLDKDLPKNKKALESLKALSKTLHSKCTSPTEVQKLIKKHFSSYDTNGNCQLDVKEFTKALDAFAGGSVSKEEIERIFCMIDGDSSEYVDYNEFADAIISCIS